MKTKNILLALLSIFFLGACHSQQTGIYNIMDYGATVSYTHLTLPTKA